MYKKVQGNGSITIPAKMRHRLGIEPHAAMELVEGEDGSVIFRPYQPVCIFCGNRESVSVVKGVQMCRECYDRVRRD